MLSAARKKKIKELLNKLKIETADEFLFDEALTHPSFHYELNRENAPDYERLEFLGDSVLRLVMSDVLYERYSEFDEGCLTKIRSYLVSDNFLSKLALRIELNKYLNMGIHEEKDGGRNKESILACAMEAVFGAVYVSLGYDIAKMCIENLYSYVKLNPDEILYSYNSKEILQQYTQGINKDLPQYRTVNEYGEAHDKTYEVCVFYHGEELGRGKAKTKKEAEKQAAFDSLKKLNLLEETKNE